MTYCETEDVSDYAQENGHGYWGNIDRSTQLQIVEQTTNDMEAFMRQPRQNRTPFALGNLELLDICVLQSLRNARTWSERRMSEKAASGSKAGFSVGSLNIEGNAAVIWEPSAKTRLQNWLNLSGIFNGSQFVRG